jgi:hypothetical protein
VRLFFSGPIRPVGGQKNVLMNSACCERRLGTKAQMGQDSRTVGFGQLPRKPFIFGPYLLRCILTPARCSLPIGRTYIWGREAATFRPPGPSTGP